MELNANMYSFCLVPYGNHGCSGGDTYTAMKYVIDNGGIDTESSYSFQGKVADTILNVDNNCIHVYTFLCSNHHVSTAARILVPLPLGL